MLRSHQFPSGNLVLKICMTEKLFSIIFHWHMRQKFFGYVVFRKISVRMSNAFRFKDQIPKCPNSMLLYKFTCNTCNSFYIGKTKRHLGLSVFSNKALRYSDKDATAIRNSVNNYFLQLKESLLCLQLDREETLKYRCVCRLPYGKV